MSVKVTLKTKTMTNLQPAATKVMTVPTNQTKVVTPPKVLIMPPIPPLIVPPPHPPNKKNLQTTPSISQPPKEPKKRTTATNLQPQQESHAKYIPHRNLPTPNVTKTLSPTLQLKPLKSNTMRNLLQQHPFIHYYRPNPFYRHVPAQYRHQYLQCNSKITRWTSTCPPSRLLPPTLHQRTWRLDHLPHQWKYVVKKRKEIKNWERSTLHLRALQQTN